MGPELLGTSDPKEKGNDINAINIVGCFGYSNDLCATVKSGMVLCEIICFKPDCHAERPYVTGSTHSGTIE